MEYFKFELIGFLKNLKLIFLVRHLHAKKRLTLKRILKKMTGSTDSRFYSKPHSRAASLNHF